MQIGDKLQCKRNAFMEDKPLYIKNHFYKIIDMGRNYKEFYDVRGEFKDHIFYEKWALLYYFYTPNEMRKNKLKELNKIKLN